jgi:hypothetical protein
MERGLSMDNKGGLSMDIHETIKKKFHLSNKTMRNLPYCSGQRYNRSNLAELFGEIQFNIGAEIGVRRGRYSRQLCHCNPNLKLFCIDPWSAYDTKYTQKRQNEIYAQAVKNLSGYNVQIIKKDSVAALVDIEDQSLDFVYIDGDHHFDFVCPDIINWSKKVKRGGIVAAHDSYGGEAGVQKAVEAYVHAHDIRPWYMTKELMPTAYWVNP